MREEGEKEAADNYKRIQRDERIKRAQQRKEEDKRERARAREEGREEGREEDKRERARARAREEGREEEEEEEEEGEEGAGVDEQGVPECWKCHKKILSVHEHNAVHLGDVHFHYRCFKCAHCGQDFADGQIVMSDMLPYHERCAAHAGPACALCGLPIKDKAVDHDSGPVHLECFKCSSCSCSLVQTAHVDVRGTLFCGPCVKCSVCAQGFTTHRVMLKEGRLYHPECFQSDQAKTCAHCGQLILSNRMISIDQHNWHPDCMKCKRCGEAFGQGAQIVLDNDSAPLHLECVKGRR